MKAFGFFYFKYLWPIGQAVKTSPSHGGIRGSIPPWVIERSAGSLENVRFSGIFCVLNRVYGADMVAVFYDKRESCIGESEKEWKISTLFLLQTYVRSDNIRKKNVCSA